jgi:hypothetical protein
VCWFLTIAVPDAHLRELESSFAACRVLQFTRLSSSPTAAAFSAGFLCVAVTHGGCSCDLYSAPPDPEKAENDLKRQRHRLVMKGWSSSKIERALNDKAESAGRPGRTNEAAEAFNSLVAELVVKLGEIHLFAHTYTGRMHEESVGVPKPSSVTLQQFLESGFPPDTIVSVRGAAA